MELQRQLLDALRPELERLAGAPWELVQAYWVDGLSGLGLQLEDCCYVWAWSDQFELTLSRPRRRSWFWAYSDPLFGAGIVGPDTIVEGWMDQHELIADLSARLRAAGVGHRVDCDRIRPMNLRAQLHRAVLEHLVWGWRCIPTMSPTWASGWAGCSPSAGAASSACEIQFLDRGVACIDRHDRGPAAGYWDYSDPRLWPELLELVVECYVHQ